MPFCLNLPSSLMKSSPCCNLRRPPCLSVCRCMIHAIILGDSRPYFARTPLKWSSMRFMEYSLRLQLISARRSFLPRMAQALFRIPCSEPPCIPNALLMINTQPADLNNAMASIPIFAPVADSSMSGHQCTFQCIPLDVAFLPPCSTVFPCAIEVDSFLPIALNNSLSPGPLRPPDSLGSLQPVPCHIRRAATRDKILSGEPSCSLSLGSPSGYSNPPPEWSLSEPSPLCAIVSSGEIAHNAYYRMSPSHYNTLMLNTCKIGDRLRPLQTSLSSSPRETSFSHMNLFPPSGECHLAGIRLALGPPRLLDMDPTR